MDPSLKSVGECEVEVEEVQFVKHSGMQGQLMIQKCGGTIIGVYIIKGVTQQTRLRFFIIQSWYDISNILLSCEP